jgi:hypothetical protein
MEKQNNAAETLAAEKAKEAALKAEKVAKEKAAKEKAAEAAKEAKDKVAVICKKYGAKEIYRNSRGEYFTSRGLALNSEKGDTEKIQTLKA